jgi:hypothetical protein
MKPYLIEAAKALLFIVRPCLNKTEWLLITLTAVLINICLSPNFMIDVDIVRLWIRDIPREMRKLILFKLKILIASITFSKLRTRWAVQ